MDVTALGPNVPPMRHREVSIQIDGATITGDLHIPGASSAIVLFAHGSGSSRHSSRNKFVAQAIHEKGIATLLIDLLSPEEEEIDNATRQLRFDIPFLAQRLAEVIGWLKVDIDTRDMCIGLFGASTGAAAALLTASTAPEQVRAVVSRGGRPDLVANVLSAVKAPSLFIVGEADEWVLNANQKAYKLLTTKKKFVIIPGATHLFEERGTLEEVAKHAGEFFEEHLFFPHCKTGAA